MTAMRLHRYPSPSGGIALGKMGVGATMMSNILPAGARWVEYLQGDGRSYINTGIYTADNIGIRVTAQRMIDLLSDVAIFGARYYGVDTRFFIGAQVDSKFYFGWNSRIDYGTVDYGVHVFSMNYLNDRKAKLDGVEAGTLSSSISFPLVITLLGLNNRGNINSNSGAYWRVSRFQMTQGSTLVRDFRPIAIGTTGYMLDLVTGDYLQYGNAGTGNLVIGPDTNAPAI